MGLSRGFRQGVVVCTPITAALVRLKLKVPPERLRVLQLGQEVVIEGESVNQCVCLMSLAAVFDV